jgi:preprotein translocase subunit SecA
VDREGLKVELIEDAQKAYEERESQLGEEVMRYIERTILLQVIDNRWREHLYDMDYLREGIHLRGFAQIDPLVAYKNEGYSMFSDLMHAIWEEFSKLIFNVEVQLEPNEVERAFAAVAEGNVENLDYSGGTLEGQPSALAEVAAGSTPGPAETGGIPGVVPGGMASIGGQPGSILGGAAETKVKTERESIGRNDPCWCGSGKKFKKCHGA